MKKHILKVWMMLAISFLAVDVAGQVYNPKWEEPKASNSPTLTITFEVGDELSFASGKTVSLYKIENTDYILVKSFSTGSSGFGGSPRAPELHILEDVFTLDLSGYTLDWDGTYAIHGQDGFITVNNTPFNDLTTPNWTFTIEAQPLELTTKSPIDGATGVLLDQSLVATFNQNIQFATGAEVSVYAYVGDVWVETLTEGAGLSITGMELTINPTADFAEGTRYYVTVPAGAIETTTGTPFAGMTSKDDWDFTTVYLPLNPPTLNPSNGDPGIPRNSILEVAFDKDIEFGSGGTVEIFNGATQEKVFTKSTPGVSIFNNKTLRIDLSANPLAEYATLYDVRISSGFIKRAGINIDFTGFAAGEWSFTTEAQPLELTLKSPLDGATDVPLTQSLVATFNQNIQLAAGAEVYLRTYDGDTPVETLTALSGLSVLGMELTINPTADFSEGTRYYVVIPAGAIETTSTPATQFSGVTLKDDWDFTSENLAPTVVTYDPDGLTAVVVDKVLNLTFDRPIKFNNLEQKSIRIRRYSNENIFHTYVIDGVDTDGLLSVSGNVLTITPPVNYESSTQYYVEISDGAILSLADVAFPGITNKETWKFTTDQAAPAPMIVSEGYSPAPTTLDVPLNSILTLNFNEEITLGNSGLLRIRYGTTDGKIFSVSSSDQVSVSGTQLTINLSEDALKRYNTQYHVLIDAGFVKSSTTGVDFVGISSSSEWYFTTETAPPFWVDGYPSITNQTMDDFVFNSWADVEGTYFGVVTQSPTPPTAEQISQGLNQGGTAARIAFNRFVDEEDNSLPSLQTVAFNEFTQHDNTYYLHAVYRNGTKYSERRTLTIDRIVPKILSSNPYNGLVVFPVGSELSISFSESVVGSDGNTLTAAYFSLVKDGEPVEVVGFGFTVETISEITTVTLTPTLALDPNAAYTLTINPVYDLNGNVSTAMVVNFETDGVSTWTGLNSTDWTVATNWQGSSYVPFKSVVIPSGLTIYPEIATGTVDVHNLTIESGATLTQIGGVLNVTGEFHLLSSPDRNASYLTKGGSLTMGDNANVFVHQSIPVPNDEWIFLMGSPTLGANALNSGSGFHMRQYDNTTDTWSSIGLNNMVPGVGYSVYSNNDLTLRGDINRSAVIANLTRTDGMGFGWNVLGNPFTSSIKWSDVIDHIDNLGVLDVIENNYWVWNPSQNIYNAFNQEAGVGIDTDGTIPSNHGFLVKVAIGQTGGNLVLVPEAQVANTNNYLKSASTIPDFVKLRADGGDYHDKLAIAFIDKATEGLDKYDTEKRFGSGVNPFEIFSVSGTTNLTINSAPYYTNKEVSLGFNARKVGTYTFGIDDSNIEGVDILLLDKVTGDVTNLQGSEVYSFEVNTTGRNTSRFSLRFVGAIATKDVLSVFESRTTSSLIVFVNENNIFVEVSESLVGSNYQVHDLSGRLLQSDVFLNSGTQRIGQFSKGIYLLSVETKGEAPMIQKIVVY